MKFILRRTSYKPLDIKGAVCVSQGYDVPKYEIELESLDDLLTLLHEADKKYGCNGEIIIGLDDWIYHKPFIEIYDDYRE